MDSSSAAPKAGYVNVYMLRLFAIVLIMNAHMGSIYPHNAYAFGGYLGNSLFFFVSGLGLSLSRSSKLPYFAWVQKRFLNLLLPITILVAIVELDPGKSLATLTKLLIPHELSQLQSFFPNLVILYLAFWPVSRLSMRNLGLALAGLSLIPQIILFCFPSIIHESQLSLGLIFFPVTAWMAFLAGMVVARLLMKGHFQDSTIAATCCGALGCLVCAGLQLAAGRFSADAIRVLALHMNLLTVLLLFYTTLLVNRLSPSSFAAASFKQLAILSLPVYVIHFKVIRWVAPFEINPVIKVGLIFIVSFALAKIFDFFYSLIRNKSKQILLSEAH